MAPHDQVCRAATDELPVPEGGQSRRATALLSTRPHVLGRGSRSGHGGPEPRSAMRQLTAATDGAHGVAGSAAEPRGVVSSAAHLLSFIPCHGRRTSAVETRPE